VCVVQESEQSEDIEPNYYFLFRDISFLYDIQVDEDDDDDVPKEDSVSNFYVDIANLYNVLYFMQQILPATLIPKEYHIVKHPGVMGLEFHDE